MPVVSKTKGTLSVKPTTGQEHDVSTAQRTKEGDTLKTAAGSLADIALADLARMRLGPATSARVLRTDGGLTLDLMQGGICVVATSGQVGVSSGVTLTTANAPAIYSVTRNSAGETLLAVYRGEVRTGGGLSAVKGQAYTLAKTGEETAVLISTVTEQLAPLQCPEPAIIADALANEVPLPQPERKGGGGALGIILGAALLGAAAGGGGGGGGKSSPPAAGKIAALPTNIGLTVGGASATVTVTEANYTGPFTVAASPAGIVSVSPASANGPIATFSVSPVSSGVTTLTFSDNHSPKQTVTVQAAVSSGTLVLNPSTIRPLAIGARATFTASEANYTGTFTANSSNAGAVSVSPASANVSGGQPATFTVTGVSAGQSAISITDQNRTQSFLNVTVTGALSLSPTSLTISGSSGTITASEPYYTGTLNATLAGCSGIASLASNTATANGGPNSSGSFTINAIGAGTCSVTIGDDHSQSRTASITVTSGSLSVTPSTAQTISVAGSPNVSTSFTATATETNFTGTFTATSSPGNIVSIAPSTRSGASTGSFTVSSATAGTTTVSISDGTNSRSIPVTVTGRLNLPDLGLSPTVSSTLTATEPYFSGTITLSLTANCTAVSIQGASSVQASGGSGSSASFTVRGSSVGSCGATVTDSRGQTDTATITVQAGSLNVNPSAAQTISLAGDTTSFNATASEGSFSGTFTATSTPPNIVAISPTSASGPSATFSISAAAAGTTTVTISDGSTSRTIPVTVVGILSLSPSPLAISGSSGTLTATDPYYSGTLTVTPSGCGSVASFPTTSKTASGGGSSNAQFTVNAVAAGSCTATVTDDQGQSKAVTITVSGGTLSLTPSGNQTINSAGSGTTLSLTANETNFGGAFSASSSNTAIATVSPLTRPGPSGTFTVTGVTPGTATISVSDGTPPDATVNVTVTGPLTAPNAVTFSGATTTFTVTEPYYSGPITATLSSNCAGRATLAGGATQQSITASGGPTSSSTFTLQAVGAGSCTASLTDNHNQVDSTLITVQPGTFVVTPDTAQTLGLSGTPTSLQATATEPNFTGTFTPSSTPNNLVSFAPASRPGPSGAFTVTAAAAGTGTVSISDGTISRSFPITVYGALSVSPTTLTIDEGASATTGDLTVSEPYYTGALNATLTAPCTGFATLDSPSKNGSGGSGSSATFTITAQPVTADVTCTANVTDDHGSTAQATVTVIAPTAAPVSSARRRFSAIGSGSGAATAAAGQAGQLTASETNVTMRIAGNGNRTRTISIVDAGYTGAFTVTSSLQSVATASIASSGPGSAQLTLQALTSGTTLVTVADSNGNRLTIPVTVQTGARGIGAPIRRKVPALP